jgi:hypothetical protein
MEAPSRLLNRMGATSAFSRHQLHSSGRFADHVVGALDIVGRAMTPAGVARSAGVALAVSPALWPIRAVRASRCHPNSCCGLNSCRRVTSDMLATDHRRRQVPVITSIRRTPQPRRRSPRLLSSQPASESVSAVRMAWTAIAAMTPVRNSPETPIPIACARVIACRGTISP